MNLRYTALAVVIGSAWSSAAQRRRLRNFKFDFGAGRCSAGLHAGHARTPMRRSAALIPGKAQPPRRRQRGVFAVDVAEGNLCPVTIPVW